MAMCGLVPRPFLCGLLSPRPHRKGLGTKLGDVTVDDGDVTVDDVDMTVDEGDVTVDDVDVTVDDLAAMTSRPRP